MSQDRAIFPGTAKVREVLGQMWVIGGGTEHRTAQAPRNTEAGFE